MPDLQEEATIWGPVALEETGSRRFRCSSLVLWVRREGDEFLLASAYDEGEGTGSPEEPAGDKWTRFVVRAGTEQIQFSPCTPDCPLVLEPGQPFRVVPAASADIYVDVPVWVRVSIIDGRSKELKTLAELPAAVLSQSWFGELDAGELCYWLTSPARRQANGEASLPREGIFTAPVRLRNASEENLEVTRVCLRTGGLSLYESGDRLWSNETLVRYRGGYDSSQVRVLTRPPRQISDQAGARKVGDPRDPAETGLAARTFRTLQRFAGFGADDD